MKLTKIIRTPKAEVSLTREDVRLIAACAKVHYDCSTMNGSLNRLRLYVEDADPAQVILEFHDLDLSAKMLEKSLCLPDEADRQKAYELHNQIKDLLRDLNQYYEEVIVHSLHSGGEEKKDVTVPFPDGDDDGDEVVEEDDRDYC